MSGGSYDYAEHKLEDLAESIRHQRGNPLRKAFADHLRLIAKAMHAIEWVDSGDWSEGDEDDAVRAVVHPDAEIAAAMHTALDAAAALEKALDNGRKALEGRQW